MHLDRMLKDGSIKPVRGVGKQAVSLLGSAERDLGACEDLIRLGLKIGTEPYF